MGGTQSSDIPGGGSEGYHVLKVCVHDWLAWLVEGCVLLSLQVIENSPAQQAGLEAFFDFIIAIDGVRLVCEKSKSWFGK